MSENKKAKNIGKICIIILSAAILIFILLPFLDSSAAEGNKNNKKAAPQIFTSNPLTDLVKKIYALFSGNNKQPDAHPGAPSAQEEQSAVRYASGHTDNTATAGGSVAVSAPAAADTPDDLDGFIDESGEWVLIRQTAPDMSQRGMHEVNTSDTAYDKLVRMERAAKYTGVSALSPTQQIPSSKWARLWEPVKQLFGSHSSEEGTETAAMLAAAKSDFYDRENRLPTQRFARTNTPDIPLSGFRKNTPSAPAGFSLLDMLNPLKAFENMKDTVREWYAPAEGQPDSEKNKQSREAALKFLEEKEAQMRQQRIAQVQLDAQDQEPASLWATFSCATSSSSYKNDTGSCFILSEEERQQQAQEARQQRELSLAALTAELGFTPPPLNMVIVLGKQAANEPVFSEDDSEDARLVKEFYSYLAQNKCPGGDCYWIGSGRDAEDVITAAGGVLTPDPLGLAGINKQAFIDKKLQEARQNNMPEEELKQLQESLNNMQAAYTAYNTNDWNEMQAQTKPGQTNPDNTAQPAVILTPLAANADTFIHDTPYPALVFYDNTNTLFNADATMSPAEQGAALNGQMVARIYEVRDEMQQIQAELVRMNAAGALQEDMQQFQQRLGELKKEWERLQNHPQK